MVDFRLLSIDSVRLTKIGQDQAVKLAESRPLQVAVKGKGGDAISAPETRARYTARRSKGQRKPVRLDKRTGLQGFCCASWRIQPGGERAVRNVRQRRKHEREMKILTMRPSFELGIGTVERVVSCCLVLSRSMRGTVRIKRHGEVPSGSTVRSC